MSPVGRARPVRDACPSSVGRTARLADGSAEGVLIGGNAPALCGASSRSSRARHAPGARPRCRPPRPDARPRRHGRRPRRGARRGPRRLLCRQHPARRARHRLLPRAPLGRRKTAKDRADVLAAATDGVAFRALAAPLPRALVPDVVRFARRLCAASPAFLEAFLDLGVSPPRVTSRRSSPRRRLSATSSASASGQRPSAATRRPSTCAPSRSSLRR